MKKLLTILLSLLVVFTLAGCNNGSGEGGNGGGEGGNTAAFRLLNVGFGCLLLSCKEGCVGIRSCRLHILFCTGREYAYDCHENECCSDVIFHNFFTFLLVFFY